MTRQLNAGDFESKFSEFLADALILGRQLDLHLVGECYQKTAKNLDLPPTGADNLYIENIYSSLSIPTALHINVNAGALRKKIFDLIYMH